MNKKIRGWVIKRENYHVYFLLRIGLLVLVSNYVQFALITKEKAEVDILPTCFKWSQKGCNILDCGCFRT